MSTGFIVKGIMFNVFLADNLDIKSINVQFMKAQ